MIPGMTAPDSLPSSPLLEISPYEVEGGHIIGRDPRKIAAHEFDGAGLAGRPVLEVIKAKCLDCSAGATDEVRKCVSIGCALWPYRMGANPFRTVTLSDDERERRRARLASRREAGR
jgi:hypothetical protein